VFERVKVRYAQQIADQAGGQALMAWAERDALVPSEGDPNAPLSANPMTLVLRETIDPQTVLGAAVQLSVLVRGEQVSVLTIDTKSPARLCVHERKRVRAKRV
jgi:hypothetical protein